MFCGVSARCTGRPPTQVLDLLMAIEQGRMSATSAFDELARLPYDLGFAKVDLHGELRQGAPEAVLAERTRWGSAVIMPKGPGVDPARPGGHRFGRPIYPARRRGPRPS
jgi:hypothetical protein